MEQAERVQLLEALRRTETELWKISSWLPEEHERAAILLSDASTCVLAALELLDRDPGRVRALVNRTPQNGHPQSGSSQRV